MPCWLWSVALTFAFVVWAAGGHRPVTPVTLSSTPLKFREDGTFRIVQFTDLHYGSDADDDALSAKIEDLILEKEGPDLVVLSGDAVSGYAWDHSEGWFKKRWDQLTGPMVKHGIPWAYVLGNHDDQGELSREEIVALDQSAPLSVTLAGPEDIHGVTNYVLPLLSSDGTQVAANVWSLDSMDTDCLGVKGWGCVYPDAVQWYRQTSASLKVKYNTTIPGLAFFHIPTPEVMLLYDNANITGYRTQDVCCSPVNTGLFAAFKEMGDVQSTHSGHDHNNDYYGTYDGVMLAYGRKTGVGGYGPDPPLKRGARVLELTESPYSLKTWIREEDGSIAQQMVHGPPLHDETKQTVCCGAINARASLSSSSSSSSRCSSVKQK